jgi:uncharacterized protein (TIGR02598 family)
MNNRTQSTAAFSLVEVTLALGVAAFCLIAILGLMPAGLNTNQTSVRQTTANGILSSIVADLRATPLTSTNSKLFQIDLSDRRTVLYFAGDGTYSNTTSANAKTIFYALVTFSGSAGGSGDSDDESGTGGGTAKSYDVKVFPYSVAGAAAAAAGGSGGSDSDSGTDGDEGSGGSGGSGGSSPGATPAAIVETFVALDRNGASTGGGED